MDKLLASTITGGNTAYSRSKSDFYPTPPEVTVALFKFFKFKPGTTFWEPACGENHMVNAIKSCGDFNVIGTDISQGVDFLTCDPIDCDFIITNPPFSKSEEFIKRAISLGKPFAFLLKSQYWHAKRRLSLFNDHQPAYILPLTWRPDFLFKTRGSGAPLMDVMWVVWSNTKAPFSYYCPLPKPLPEDVTVSG